MWGGSSTTLPSPCRDNAEAGPGREIPSHQPANGRTSSPSDPETGRGAEQHGVAPTPLSPHPAEPGEVAAHAASPTPRLGSALVACALLYLVPPYQGGPVGKLPPVLFLQIQNKKLGANIHQTHNQKFARESKSQI